MLRILFIGDIFAKAGRKAVEALLPDLRKELGIDCVIGNAENLAHGHGVTTKTLTQMKEAGIDFFTSGNHIWGNGEVYKIFSERQIPLLRPGNYPSLAPGSGDQIFEWNGHRLLVINLMGRLFMRESLDCPFRALDTILEKYANEKLDGIFVDFHAETTGETNSFGHYADGRVSVVVGTHTHIPTADERVLPLGTAFITDVGMVGVLNSSIGFDPKQAAEDFKSQLPKKHCIPESGLTVFNSVCIELDEKTKKALSIVRIQRTIDIS